LSTKLILASFMRTRQELRNNSNTSGGKLGVDFGLVHKSGGIKHFNGIPTLFS